MDGLETWSLGLFPEVWESPRPCGHCPHNMLHLWIHGIHGLKTPPDPAVTLGQNNHTALPEWAMSHPAENLARRPWDPYGIHMGSMGGWEFRIHFFCHDSLRHCPWNSVKLLASGVHIGTARSKANAGPSGTWGKRHAKAVQSFCDGSVVSQHFNIFLL